MPLSLIISGTNSRIPADAFQTIGRGWQSQGHGGHARSSAKDNRDLEVPSITSRGGGRPLAMTAADWGFWFLCLLIFAGTPLWMVLR